MYKIKFKDVKKEKFWFSSDWHLYHTNIIKYDKRPFKSIKQMNERIISNMSILPEDHHLFFLGDLAFRYPEELDSFMYRVKCHKYFIVGNHDKEVFKKKFLDRHFTNSYSGYCELTVNDQMIVMSHYPFFEWNKGHRGSWHLFGHTHGNDKNNPNIRTKRTMNVGVMLNEYKPFNYLEIEKIFKTRQNITHH
jgi:calcineurin-like phosphoesterase family protein